MLALLRNPSTSLPVGQLLLALTANMLGVLSIAKRGMVYEKCPSVRACVRACVLKNRVGSTLTFYRRELIGPLQHAQRSQFAGYRPRPFGVGAGPQRVGPKADSKRTAESRLSKNPDSTVFECTRQSRNRLIDGSADVSNSHDTNLTHTQLKKGEQ
jgi:hypothetical protein